MHLKNNGKKIQNPDGKYAASWEERYHKKRVPGPAATSRTTTTTRRPSEGKCLLFALNLLD